MVARIPTKIGVIGCGVISGIYIENAKKLDALECVAVADVNPAAAQYRAEQYDIPKACSPDELLSNPEIEIVINLTPNRLHAQVSLQIIEAGKNVYSEKPLTVYPEESQRLLVAATKKGLRVGGAPDTFLGGSLQTARKAIADGLIGEPIAAMANFHGRQAINPSSTNRPVSPTRSFVPGHVSFFQTEGFKYGVTVVFDMGPYYLNALIHLLGPVKRVFGATKKAFEEDERMGSVLKVEAPTHVTGVLEFNNGVLCQFLASSDVYRTGLPHLEIYGTEGSLRCFDPNSFPGPVYLKKPDQAELIELECQYSYNQNSRGVGVADLAVAIRNGRPHRATGEMGAHVVEIINALHKSAEEGRRIDLQTTCVQPKPFPVNLPNWTIDE